MIDQIKVWLVGLAALVIPGLDQPAAVLYNGYVEADFVYVAAAQTGRIKTLWVAEGAQVSKGDQVVQLDDAGARATLSAAEARVRVAQANFANLETGSREQEIAVIRAELAKAEAERELAASNLARSERLFERGTIAETRVDTDRVALRTAEAQVAERLAQLEVAELPARKAQREAAVAALEAARADASVAKSALEDRAILAPASGRVDSLYFDVGEVVGASVPMLSILDRDRLKAVFFVPEAEISSIAVGHRLSVTCDGCGNGITAEVTRLDAAPQFTPPIIYSRDERHRLVFRAEARLIDGESLLPGQPITLEPLR